MGLQRTTPPLQAALWTDRFTIRWVSFGDENFEILSCGGVGASRAPGGVLEIVGPQAIKSI